MKGMWVVLEFIVLAAIVLLAITLIIGMLTVTPGRATLLQGGVHVSLFAAFLVLVANP